MDICNFCFKISDSNLNNYDSVASKAIINGTKNFVRFDGKKVVVSYPRTGIECILMPDIADVRTIENNGKVNAVIVSFADGTREKAILNANDIYSLEYGISVCITKRLLSGSCRGHGSSVYNKIVHHGLKVYEKAQKQAAKDAEEADRIKLKKEKAAKKKAARKAKREAKDREYLIGIQTEAYLRAMKEFSKE